MFGSIEIILPSNIVIYYSGLIEIMKEICIPNDVAFSEKIRKENSYLNLHRPFFYFEPPLFNLILLTLLSYKYGDIPQFLSDKAKIKGISSIQLTLLRPAWGNGEIDKWWGAKGEVKTFLDLLASLASTSI